MARIVALVWCWLAALAACQSNDVATKRNLLKNPDQPATAATHGLPSLPRSLYDYATEARKESLAAANSPVTGHKVHSQAQPQQTTTVRAAQQPPSKPGPKVGAALAVGMGAAVIAGGISTALVKAKRIREVFAPVRTSLSEPVLAGTSYLPVEAQTGFTVGVKVVIGEATAQEEINYIVGFGSVILKDPLIFPHPAGVAMRSMPEVNEPTGLDSLASKPVLLYSLVACGLLLSAACGGGLYYLKKHHGLHKEKLAKGRCLCEEHDPDGDELECEDTDLRPLLPAIVIMERPIEFHESFPPITATPIILQAGPDGSAPAWPQRAEDHQSTLEGLDNPDAWQGQVAGAPMYGAAGGAVYSAPPSEVGSQKGEAQFGGTMVGSQKGETQFGGTIVYNPHAFVPRRSGDRE